MTNTQAKPTPWRVADYAQDLDANTLVVTGVDAPGLARWVAQFFWDRSDSDHSEDGFGLIEAERHALLTVTAVNACFFVNKPNPLAAAEAYPQVVEALQYLLKEVELNDPDMDEDYNPQNRPLAGARAALSAAKGSERWEPA